MRTRQRHPRETPGNEAGSQSFADKERTLNDAVPQLL